MQQKNTTNSSGGYAILFAVLLVSIILAITLGILNIALKQFNFTATAKNSHVSFFAADTGGECALYGKKQGILANANPSLVCDTQILTSVITSLSPEITRFDFTPMDVQDGCALIDITIDNSDALVSRTIINSRGYNALCSNLSTSANKVERLLTFEFTEGVVNTQPTATTTGPTNPTTTGTGSLIPTGGGGTALGSNTTSFQLTGGTSGN